VIWLDFVILSIIALSVVIGVIRGFVREALSLVCWAASFWLAMTFSPRLADYLGEYIAIPAVRTVAAFMSVFLLALIAGGGINTLIVKFIRWSGLGTSDRMVGLLFGVARGVLLVAILAFVAGNTPMAKQPWWQQSLLAGYCENIANWLVQWVPQDTVAGFAIPQFAMDSVSRPLSTMDIKGR